MTLRNGAMYVSFLKALNDKQLIAHEDWQHERRCVEDSREDAENRMPIIIEEKRRRGMTYGKRA